MQTRRFWWLCGAFFLFGSLAMANDTVRVSVDSVGSQSNGMSAESKVAGNGRYVVFASDASNLVAADTNGTLRDLFVFDLFSGQTVAVSVNFAGVHGNAPSDWPSISDDGRYVVFQSDSSNLVPGDTNGTKDVFLRDLLAKTTSRISVSSTGVQANDDCTEPSISPDGRYICFSSWATNLVIGDTNSAQDIFLHDMKTGSTTRINMDPSGLQANADSFTPMMSWEAAEIAYVSSATNLVPGDVNGVDDIFILDRSTGATTMVSVDSAGMQSNASSGWISLSADGRFVAFHSFASNLVAADTNFTWDVFLRDRSTGTTSLVSVDMFGAQGNSLSHKPAISGDGRFIVYRSLANNLVPDDVNGSFDIFQYDRMTKVTELVSKDSTGWQGNASSDTPWISRQGHIAVFASDATNLVVGDSNGVADIFAGRDLSRIEVHRESVDSAGLQANGPTYDPMVSGNGWSVAFSCDATNLAPLDFNGMTDVFIRDVGSGDTECMSMALAGSGNGVSDWPSITENGRRVAFQSTAKNLVPGDSNIFRDVFVRDRDTGTTTRVSVDSAGKEADDGDSGQPSISPDGRYVAFTSSASKFVSGDYNGVWDIFVHDTQTGFTQRVSVDSFGIESNYDAFEPVISTGGRYVAFHSMASNLAPFDFNNFDDVFVHDTLTGATTRVSVSSSGAEANGDSFGASISADGRFVTFESLASNLVPNDTNGTWDVFVRDRQTGETKRVSVDSMGLQANGASVKPALSSEGRYVAFRSLASNLVAGDFNGTWDVFVHDRETGVTERRSTDSAGQETNGSSDNPSISTAGNVLAFSSMASNLVWNDTNGVEDVFGSFRSEVEFRPFGEGLAGSGGFVPELWGNDGTATTYLFGINDGLGLADGILWVSPSYQDNYPFFGGHFYLDFSSWWVMLLFKLGGTPGVPGSGDLLFYGMNLSTGVGSQFFLQATIFDPGAVQGVAFSNGLSVSIED